MSTFSKNGVFADPCEPNCKPNEVQPKGTMIRGLGYFAAFANSASDKSAVTSMLETTMSAMIKTCQNGACGGYWADNVAGSNFHFQTNALELVNAFGTAKFGLSNAQLTPPKSAAPTKNAAEARHLHSLAVTMTLLCILSI
jgi:hypothetical protein